MQMKRNDTAFDPDKVRFDLSLSDAFALTRVCSLQEFSTLQERLRLLRGQSYFFVNILKGKPRLIMTIITAEEQEITATYELEISSLGICPEELVSENRMDGNYPLPAVLIKKIKFAADHTDFRLSKMP